LTLVHIEHIGQQAYAWMRRREGFVEAPMRGGCPASKEPGRGQHERAPTDGGHASASRVRSPQCFEKNLWRGVPPFVAPAGHDDEGGLRKQFQSAIDLQRNPAPGPQRTGLDGCDGEPIPARTHFRTRQAEHFDSDAELEHRQAIVGYRDHQGAVSRNPGWREIWHDLHTNRQ